MRRPYLFKLEKNLKNIYSLSIKLEKNFKMLRKYLNKQIF